MKIRRSLIEHSEGFGKAVFERSETLGKTLMSAAKPGRIRIEICENIIKRSEIFGEAVLSGVKNSLKLYGAHQTSGEAVLGVATISAKLY